MLSQRNFLQNWFRRTSLVAPIWSWRTFSIAPILNTALTIWIDVGYAVRHDPLFLTGISDWSVVLKNVALERHQLGKSVFDPIFVNYYFVQLARVRIVNRHCRSELAPPLEFLPFRRRMEIDKIQNFFVQVTLVLVVVVDRRHSILVFRWGPYVLSFMFFELINWLLAVREYLINFFHFIIF